MTADSRDPIEAKRATRQLVLTQRDAIDSEVRRERSAQICQRLQTTLDRHFAKGLTTPTIALYHAMKSEVDLAPLAQTATEQGWRICYPIMLEKQSNKDGGSCPHTAEAVVTDNVYHPHCLAPISQSGSMAFFAPPSFAREERHSVKEDPAAELTQEPAQEILAHPLQRHGFAELEAAGFAFVPPKTIDAIVVPLVAFDSHNFRLGYGGGNYDTFLPQLRQDCLVMGVAFEEQQVEAVPLEPHDLPLPSIIVG